MRSGPQLFRIDIESGKSESIEEIEFARRGFWERRDIQEWVAANPAILGENLLIIAKEFSGFDRTSERLDLLAVDINGSLVVIELKRDDTGTDAHWQAIKYASYLHNAKGDDFAAMLARYKEVSEEDARQQILEHIQEDDLDILNRNQRIILASHRFAPEVTSAALWLNTKASEDLVTCIQLTPYQDTATGALYIQANTIIPVPGIEAYVINIGESPDGGGAVVRKLKQTYDRSRDNECTPFLIRVGELTVEGLKDEIRPDRKSKWAGLGGGGERYYHLWYKREPWKNWGMSYTVNIRRNSSDWEATIGLEYKSSGIRDMKGILQSLHVHDDQRIEEWGAFVVSRSGSELDEAFAKTLADAWRPFIEAITPQVHEAFDSEHNEEDS